MKVKYSKYHGSTIQSNGQWTRQVKKRSAGRIEWVETSDTGDCDKSKGKGKIYKMTVRPVMMFGLKMVELL